MKGKFEEVNNEIYKNIDERESFIKRNNKGELN